MTNEQQDDHQYIKQKYFSRFHSFFFCPFPTIVPSLLLFEFLETHQIVDSFLRSQIYVPQQNQVSHQPLEIDIGICKDVVAQDNHAVLHNTR
jgi:hypothetical protein